MAGRGSDPPYWPPPPGWKAEDEEGTRREPPYWPPPPGWQAEIEREAAEEKAELAAIERSNEEKLRLMREEPPPEGIYTVTLTSVVDSDDNWLPELLSNLAKNPAVDLPDDDILFERVAHIGPQIVVTGVSDDYAIRLKKTLEWAGGKVKITEGVVRLPSDGSRREAIPERVRNEVWRRDSGHCVDCGSRERLEYDHIIPVSKGGANTARNIELRCQDCNRKKAARI